MKATSTCLVCGIKQAMNLLKKVSKDDEFIWNGLRKVMKGLSKAEYGLTPAQLAEYFYPELSEYLGVEDPFEDEKKLYNDKALIIFNDIERMVLKMKDWMKTAAKLAIVGNSIDFGVPSFKGMDIEREIMNEASHKLEIDDFDEFVKELERSKSILYILDNCGEVVFDKLFMKFIKMEFPNLEIFSVVRTSPIINDVTMKEAIYVGLDEVSEIVDSGIDLPGIVFERTNEDFKRLWNSVDLIVSKGQGNFEGLEDIKDTRIFFFLKAKCDVISDYLKIPKGSLILMRNR